MVARELAGDIERTRDTILTVEDVRILERKGYDGVPQRGCIAVDPWRRFGQLGKKVGRNIWTQDEMRWIDNRPDGIHLRHVKRKVENKRKL